MSMLINYIVDIGFDAVKDKVINLKDQKELKYRLHTFIESNASINKSCTIEEELDFKGLSDYIRSNLIIEVRKRLFGNLTDRRAARESIISKAVHYSQSNTNIASKRTIKLVADAIDILRAFYREKINWELKFIATEIEDNIINEMNNQFSEQKQSITSTIQECNNQVIEKIDNKNLLSIDKNIQLIKDGKIDQVESILTSYISALNGQHILFPNYGYTIKHIDGVQRLHSVPLSKDAELNYPQSIKCIGYAKIGNQYINEFSSDIIDYADRHQLPITINVKDAQKLLGDIPDPAQYEAQKLIGKEVKIIPKPFPEAFPCSVIINGNVEFDYVLLRTQEILDDGTFIIASQERENFPFVITIRLKFDGQSSVNINMASNSNSDWLQYILFMKKSLEWLEVEIKALSIGKYIIKGKLEPIEYNGGFSTIEDEISFFEKIVALENYFGKNINVPNEIYKNDFDIICYLFTLITGDVYTGFWEHVELKFELTEEFKLKIKEIINLNKNLSYTGEISTLLYGKEYKIPVSRTYNHVCILDLESVIRKSEVLDVGDIIKIKYIPNLITKTSTYNDVLYDDTISKKVFI